MHEVSYLLMSYDLDDFVKSAGILWNETTGMLRVKILDLRRKGIGLGARHLHVLEKFNLNICQAPTHFNEDKDLDQAP